MPRKEASEQESAYDELMSDPMLPPDSGGGIEETAYDKVIDILTVIGEEPLELMTRTTPIIARASAVSYSMCATFHSRYIGERMNQVMRLAVSYGGKGRDEMVRSLGASAGAFSLPNGGGPDSAFMPATED